MNRTASIVCLAGLVVLSLALAAPLRAQQPNAPHLAYVYPAGARQGTTVKVNVGGRFLGDVSAVLVSGAGLRAEAGVLDKPMTQREIQDLRERLQERQKQGAMTPAIRQELQEARLRIGDSLRRNANPNLSEKLAVEVTIAPDARPGHHELRLVTPLGVSNPVIFCVGQLPEFAEKDEKSGPADAETVVTLPAIVNGRMIPGDVDRAQFPLRQAPQYMPGDVDRYRFAGKKGQELVIAVSARELMPYLADAVPGWFQATVALLDSTGRELAFQDDFRFHPDPVLHYRLSEDGEYVVQIKDALFRGREDFVYRIAIGELPFVTSLFPLGGPAGAKTVVQVSGWNLSARHVSMDTKGAAPGLYPLPVGTSVINTIPFVVDSLPEVTEREPNGAKEPQRVSLPVIVNGRIQQPGDEDVFSFTGRAGQQVVIEVNARRAASPLDSVVELADAAGARVAFNDDAEDKGAGLLTHQADSLVTATLPSSGTYSLRIGDAQHKGGSEYGYRLRVSPPRADFELRVTPSAVNVPGGMAVPVTLTALRKDGFAGEIALSLSGAPPGFSLSGGMLPAGQNQVRVTVTAPPGATPQPIAVAIEGRATIAGKTVSRRAVPAEEMMQAFAYRHLVPAEGPLLSVLGRGGARVPIRLLDPQPVKIPSGGSAKVRVTLPPGLRLFEKIEFQLSEPPDGVVIGELSLNAGGAEFFVRADAARAKPGLKGNLIVTVSGERVPANANAQQKPAARRRIPMATLPAISFEVTAPR